MQGVVEPNLVIHLWWYTGHVVLVGCASLMRRWASG